MIFTSAASSALRLTRAWLGWGAKLSERSPRDGLLKAPGDFGCALPTLLPGQLTEEQTSFSGMRVLLRMRPNKVYHGKRTNGCLVMRVAQCGTRTGGSWTEQRVVVFGAWTAGVGMADQIRDHMVRHGLSKEDATRRIWLIAAVK